MESNLGVRLQLIGKVREAFNRAYPYLKVEFGNIGNIPLSSSDGDLSDTEEFVHDGARNVLEKDVQLSDHMKVSELETSLQQLFGTPVQVFRKSGNFWMETRMSKNWTLKQQNDHGKDITSAFL